MNVKTAIGSSVIAGLLVVPSLASPASAHSREAVWVDKELTRGEAEMTARTLRDFAVEVSPFCAAQVGVKNIPGKSGVGAVIKFTVSGVTVATGASKPCDVAKVAGATALDLWTLRSKKPRFQLGATHVHRLLNDVCSFRLQVNKKARTMRLWTSC